MTSADPFLMRHLVWAIFLGGLSAVSLPLGSLVGLLSRPRPVVVGILAAFGAGALIAALAVELVAPTATAVMTANGAQREHAVAGLLALLAGGLGGGILFVVLDQVVNAHGGFLRKYATTVEYLTRRRRQRSAALLAALSRVKLLTSVPADATRLLVDLVFPATLEDGETLFSQDDEGDRLFFITAGAVALFKDGQPLAELREGEVLGEIALLTGARRTATAVAKGRVSLLVLRQEDFARLRTQVPELDAAARRVALDRLEGLASLERERLHEAMDWARRATEAVCRGKIVPGPRDYHQARQEHKGAPLAIWLGILLDGIPESFVIGAGFLAVLSARLATGATPGLLEVVPYTLIAGLFLSNFPEAMSSSVGMRSFGLGAARILFLWTTLMVITALGAGVGFLLGERIPHTAVVGVEGMAAGAMLTMIASTMIPEAVHEGGANVVGLSTLTGFLASVAFKLLE
jgi:CRP-like cAMP-binding protein